MPNLQRALTSMLDLWQLPTHREGEERREALLLTSPPFCDR